MSIFTAAFLGKIAFGYYKCFGKTLDKTEQFYREQNSEAIRARSPMPPLYVLQKL